ncbi:MAG: carboxylating nicotinate-nucleotide diphosphorylase [Acidimicrobiia bacterium]|nr:carboxylating nicotinate-nucleotide diphosphorylase [Acidimicrobiia bacterium]
MGRFSPPITAVRAAVTRALEEDLVPLGDISSALLPPEAVADARFVTRGDGVLAGTDCATEAFAQLDPAITCRWSAGDGDHVRAGDVLGTVEGPLAPVLTGERTALNFLCHLSGIATLAQRFVEAAGPTITVWDTRKTTPGLRALEKAAVRAGGAVNHRGNLSEWVMLKDNHLTVLGVADGVARARAAHPGKLVHIECDTVEKVQEALEAGADALLLDNMEPEDARRCVKLADEHAAAVRRARPLIELSGGITLETVRRFADLGADLVSSGAITNSAPVLDIGLDIEVG